MKKANKPRIQHLRNGDRREFLNSRPLWATQGVQASLSYTENLGVGVGTNEVVEDARLWYKYPCN